MIPALRRDRARLIRRDGRRLVDAAGRPVVLRGVNLGGWLQWEGWMFGKGLLATKVSMETRLAGLLGEAGMRDFRERIYEEWITEGDLAAIAALGFNVVRIPLHRDSLEGDREPRAWQRLDRVLDWCETHGLWAVFDLHCAPGSQSPWPPSDPARWPRSLWRTPAAQDRTVAIWRLVAERYAQRDVVAGYDLLNEPWPPDGPTLMELYQRIVAAIRSVDRRHLIILEGGTFGYTMSHVDRILDDNQCLSFHMYTWFDDTRRAHMARYRAQAARLGLPVWCGEFGENTHEMIRTTVDLYEDPEAVLSGWAFWTWKRAPNWYPTLRVVEGGGDWARTMRWLGGVLPLSRPDAATVRRGLDAFLAAAACGRHVPDPAMHAALRLPQPDRMPAMVRT